MRRFIDIITEAEIPPAVHDYERRATRMDRLLDLLSQLRRAMQNDQEVAPLIDQLIDKLRYRSLGHRNKAIQTMSDVLASG